MTTAEHRLFAIKARQRYDRKAELEDLRLASAGYDMARKPLTAREQAAHRERVLLARAERHEARADWREAVARLEVAS